MRDKAVTTLPLGCFNKDTLEVRQDPAKGVETKFGKPITTVLFRFDETMLNHIVEWAEYLTGEKLFAFTDPIFPRSKREHVEDGLTFLCKNVEPVFWKGTSSIRSILLKRSEDAGLEYYKPHSFRHAAVNLATRRCRTPEEFKAVSQNFGHEHIGTTMMTYGKLEDSQVAEILARVDFSGELTDRSRLDMVDNLHRIIDQLK